jgi:hypothetical protein
MCQGRCAGCGLTGPYRDIRSHTISCPEFAALVRFDPGAALEPAQEYARYVASGAQAEAKAESRAAQVADTDARRAAMAERFRTRDPLED